VEMDNGKYYRSITETLGLRAVGALVVALIVFVLTNRLALAISVGALSLIAKTILYCLHEKIWTLIDSRKGKPNRSGAKEEMF